MIVAFTMNRGTDWLRWILMAVLAVVAIYFFLFNNRAVPSPVTPPEGAVTDSVLASTIQTQLQLVNQSPEKLDHRLRLCMIYESNGLDDSAASCYQQLTELVPDHPRAWYHLGILRSRMGDIEGGMTAMRTSVEHAGPIIFPHWRLGLMLLDAGQPDEAMGHLEVSRQQLGNDQTLLAAIMRAEIDRGDPAAAIEIASQHSLFESSIGPYAYQLAAKAHEMLGNESLAAEALAMSSTGTPAMGDSWMLEVSQQRFDLPSLKGRIMAAVRAQNWTLALAMLETLRQHEEPTTEVRLLEATCLSQSGSVEQAIHQLKQVLKGAPDNRQVILALANVQLDSAELRQDLTQAEAALEAAETILEEDPTDLAANAVCIRSLKLLGRPAEAIVACRAAWATNARNIQPLALAAELIGKNELWVGNDDLLNALWMVQPDHPAAGSLLVLALVEDGRVAEAERILATLKSTSLHGPTLAKARDAVAASKQP